MRMWKTKLLTFALALVSTIALGQTATTFIYTKNVGSRTNALAPLTLDAATTAARWREADATLNNKQWEWSANTEQFRLGLLDDTGTLGGSAFLIDRTGTVVDTIAYGGAMRALSNGTLSLPAYSFANDVDTGMYLNATNDLRFTVNAVDKMVLAASGVLTPNIQLQMLTNPLITNVNPILWMQETGVAADNTIWDFNVNAEQLRFQLSNDALNAQTNWLTVDRTGNTADLIAQAATAIQLNSSSVTTTGNLLISKDDPQFNMVDTTGPGADEGRWSILNQTGSWTLRTRTDADGGGNNAIAIGRTGTTVGTIALTGTSVTLNGVAASDFARLSQANTFTGNTQQITNTSGPRLVLRDTDATADQQCFFMLSQSGQFDLYAATDSNCTSTTGGESMFQVTKAGAVVDEIRYPNGTVRVSTDHSPAFVVGPTIANITSRSGGSGVIAAAQVNGSAATESTSSLTRANGANSAGPILFLNKSRGSIGAPTTVVASSDDIGRILFSGSDSANFTNGAEIGAQVDGTPGAGDMPGRLMFSTTADGASVPTERLRIASTGAFGLSGANFGTNGQVLTSGGSAATPTWTTVSASPGGSTTQVQYNNAGAFAGDAGMTYVAGTDTLSVGTVTAATAITVAGNNVCQSTGTNCPAGSAGTLTNRNYSTSDNTVAGDCGKVIRFTGGASQTFTLDADPPVNCVLTFVNDGSASTSVAASTTLQWFNGSGTISTGTRTIAVGGVLSATVFTTQGTWQIWGSGVQ